MQAAPDPPQVTAQPFEAQRGACVFPGSAALCPAACRRVAGLPRPPCCGDGAPPARQDGWQQNPCTAPGKPSPSIHSPLSRLALVRCFWALERSSWSQAGVFHQRGLAEEGLCLRNQSGEASSHRCGYPRSRTPCFEAHVFFLVPCNPNTKCIEMGCQQGATTTPALQKCRCASNPGPHKKRRLDQVTFAPQAGEALGKEM